MEGTETNNTEVLGAKIVSPKYEIVKPWGEPEVAEHAAKFGGRRLLKEVTVTTDDDYQFVYLVKRPSRNVLKAIAEKKKGENVDTNSIEKLMLGLVLEGDMETLENDGAVYGELLKQIGGLVKSARSDIKKI